MLNDDCQMQEGSSRCATQRSLPHFTVGAKQFMDVATTAQLPSPGAISLQRVARMPHHAGADTAVEPSPRDVDIASSNSQGWEAKPNYSILETCLPDKPNLEPGTS